MSRTSERLRGQNCTWISPPRQASAAAAMTASRAPPMPISRWLFVPRMALDMAAVMSPSAMQLDAGARAAQLVDQVLVAVAVEHERREVARPAPVGLGDVLDRLGHRVGERDVGRRRPAPTAIFFM